MSKIKQSNKDSNNIVVVWNTSETRKMKTFGSKLARGVLLYLEVEYSLSENEYEYSVNYHPGKAIWVAAY